MNMVKKRFIAVFLFLIGAILVFNMAPDYELEYKYKEGDIRVIFNDTEITRNISKLPQTAILVEDEIMLSQDTVDILFDKNLYYEEKYETLITTSHEHRADLKLNTKTIKIDEHTKPLKVPPIEVKYNYKDDNRYDDKENSKRNRTEEIIYIPIKALEDVYNITVEFKDKIIITENDKNRVRITVKDNDTIELKHAKDSLSKNIETVEPGNYIDIYNYNDETEFILARSFTGELGYIAKDEINGYDIVFVTQEQEIKENNKFNIAWDYIGPEVTTIEDKIKRDKYDGLDVVAPTLLYLKNTNGEVRYNSNISSSYINWAKKNDYKVWVTLKNEYANKHFTLDETSEFLNDMHHREKAINSVIEYVKEYEIDGINVDIELIYQEDATAFSQFIRELSVKGKQNNLIISVCVNVPDGSPTWSLCYQHKALSEYADYIAVMTYDQYGASSKSAGPNASLEWVKLNMEKLVKRDKIRSDKILLGIPFYSRLWKSSPSGVTSSTINMSKAKSYLAEEPKPEWLEEAGQYLYESSNGSTLLWIEDNNSIAKKLELIEKYNLGGSAYWMLGYETSDIWETIQSNTNY